MSNLSRRSLVISAAVLPALTIPGCAAPATISSACTLPPDLIERFVRVRAWFLEEHAHESLHSAEVDRRFYAASGVTCKQYHAMNYDDPRREELNTLHSKIIKETLHDDEDVDEYSQTEADRLCGERWDVAEAMLDHQPQTIGDLAWQVEAWLLADLEIIGTGEPSMLGTIFRHIRTLRATSSTGGPLWRAGNRGVTASSNCWPARVNIRPGRAFVSAAFRTLDNKQERQYRGRSRSRRW
jgi:hypothetical protein